MGVNWAFRDLSAYIAVRSQVAGDNREMYKSLEKAFAIYGLLLPPSETSCR